MKCYIRGCNQFLRPPTRSTAGDLCPAHQIHCHYPHITYAYKDPRRNLITDSDLFMKRVRHNSHKIERHRFGLCNSEDAQSWSTFRSFQNAKALGSIVQWITGLPVTEHPHLYLWGLSSHDDLFLPWPLLARARHHFEIGKLPIERPYSEPDCCLLVPGQVLVLVECKLLAPNPIVRRGQPRTSNQSLTFEELVGIYLQRGHRLLDAKKVREAKSLHSQLFRYLIFADYLARLDGPHTQPFLANLVRAGEEEAAAHEFIHLLRPKYADRFVRVTWEGLYELAALHQPQLSRLRQFMLTKAVGTPRGFTPAFQIDTW